MCSRPGRLSFVVALFVYFASAATTVQWGDSAKLTQQIFDQAPSFALGLGAHPLHTLLGIAWARLLPVSVAYSANLLSALFGALAVGFAASTTFVLTQHRGNAWLTAALLTFAHTPWYLASLCESYTLGTFLLSLACYAAARAVTDRPRAAWWAGVALAMAPLGNSFPVFAWPGLFVWLAWAGANRGRRLGWFVGGSALGALASVGGYLTAMSWSDVWANIHGQATTYASAGQFGRQLLETPLILGFQLASPVVVVALWRSRRTHAVALLGLGLSALCLVVFAATYLRQKQFNLLVGVVVLLAIGLGVAVSRLSSPKLALAHALWMTLLYAASPTWFGTAATQALAARPVPGRDPAYFLQPWKVNRNEPSQWAVAVLGAAPERATIVADFTLGRVLQYVSASTGLRRDVRYLETDQFMRAGGEAEFVARVVAAQPVVLAQDYAPYYFTAALSSRFRILPCGPVFCLESR